MIYYKYKLLYAIFLMAFIISCERIEQKTQQQQDGSDNIQLLLNPLSVKWIFSTENIDTKTSSGLTIVQQDNKIFIANNAKVYAIDKVSGKQLWQKLLQSQNKKREIIKGEDDSVYTFFSQSKYQNHKTYDIKISAGVAVNKKYVAVVGNKGEVLVLDIENGNIINEFNIYSISYSVPLFVDDMLCIKNNISKLLCYSIDGQLLWDYSQINPPLSIRGSSDIYLHKDNIITTFDNGRIASLKKKDGSIIWQNQLSLPIGNSSLMRIVDADGQIVLDGDYLYAANYQGFIRKIDIETGKRVWSYGISSLLGGNVIDNVIMFIYDTGELVALNKNNASVLWMNDKFLEDKITTPPVVDGNSFVLSDIKGNLSWVNAKNGNIYAKQELTNNTILKLKKLGNDFLALSSSGDLFLLSDKK